MMESLPKLVDERIKKTLKTQVPLHVAQGLILEREKSQADVAKLIADSIQQECENLRLEISLQVNDAISNHIPFAKMQKTSEHGTFVFGESSSGQDYESEPGPSTSGNQEQSDDFDFWTNSYAIDDDVLPNEKVSQELVDEISQTVDEAKLRKVVDEMLRQQYKCVKRFNPYARYGVEHWKNPHAKIFYINKQQEPGKPKEEIYSNSKIIQVIKTYLELGHEHKFITEIFSRRTNGSIVSITESDYKNLNKNDIEDMYLLIINHKVDDYAETGLLWSLLVFIRSTVNWERVHDLQLGVESYQQKVNLTAPTITFPGIKKYEIVLEGLKSYNNDVKYGYVTSNLSKEDVEYLQLFAEEIEERLKHRDQMRRWQM
ncbi:hypothetical protein Tco_0868958 [Tanacetum coccineum]